MSTYNSSPNICFKLHLKTSTSSFNFKLFCELQLQPKTSDLKLTLNFNYTLKVQAWNLNVNLELHTSNLKPELHSTASNSKFKFLLQTLTSNRNVNFKLQFYATTLKIDCWAKLQASTSNFKVKLELIWQIKHVFSGFNQHSVDWWLLKMSIMVMKWNITDLLTKSH